jgi:RNA polymerase sigma factor (sigma-70 family)
VYIPACLQNDYKACYISESSPLHPHKPGRTPCRWTDDEIAAIRVVLQKLSSIRILNCSDAEDLVQDTLLTMIAKQPEDELIKGPLAWSLGILRKKVGNYYRRARRNASLGLQRIDAGQRISQHVFESSPEETVCHEELCAIVDRTLARLPFPQRRAMELFVAGHETGEIVKQLSPERYQNVINRLYRGRKKLAKELARYGYGPGAKRGFRKMKRCSTGKHALKGHLDNSRGECHEPPMP